ncbi:hypothetical protein JNUCC1_03127 [Lentibacillus sp. JNUCC-1]|uniref:hypothetical protein n=1 Tax=Lentibacillus sp. JNUCC-1 TaxID=2654513 RepID=UPI0012E77678|nr:hypothetical protein [Lentibacillus sp. JNUCC-1]MUV39254.1 hypothetical protein [Lentibacillus sp. JNUCC-1]
MALIKRFFMVGCLLSALIAIALFMTPQINGSAKSSDQADIIHREVAAKEQTVPAIDDEHVKQIINEFMDKIVQDIDKDNKVTDFDTKKALLNDFETIASRDVAEPYVDYFFNEDQNGLYIVPTETPPWFEPEEPYELERMTDHKVLVTQQNNSVFYGSYTMEIELTYDENWKITHVNEY